MSLTTVVYGVNIISPTAIERAVEMLQEQGLQVTLHKNEVPRLFFPHQNEAVGVCDYVIKMDAMQTGGRFDRKLDLGLKWDDEAGCYLPVFDDHAGLIQNAIGRPSKRNETEQSRAIRNFSQFNKAYSMAYCAETYAEMQDVSFTYEEVVNEDNSTTLRFAVQEF